MNCNSLCLRITISAFLGLCLSTLKFQFFPKQSSNLISVKTRSWWWQLSIAFPFVLSLPNSLNIFSSQTTTWLWQGWRKIHSKNQKKSKKSKNKQRYWNCNVRSLICRQYCLSIREALLGNKVRQNNKNQRAFICWGKRSVTECFMDDVSLDGCPFHQGSRSDGIIVDKERIGDYKARLNNRDLCWI